VIAHRKLSILDITDALRARYVVSFNYT